MTAPRSAWRYVKTGVRYCVRHDGIANEDHGGQCDFAFGESGACDWREMYRKERRS